MVAKTLSRVLSTDSGFSKANRLDYVSLGEACIFSITFNWIRIDKHQSLLDESDVTKDELLEIAAERLKEKLPDYNGTDLVEFTEWVQQIVEESWFNFFETKLIESGKLDEAQCISDYRNRYIDKHVSKIGSYSYNNSNPPVRVDSNDQTDRIAPSTMERRSRTSYESDESSDNFAHERNIFDEVIAELQSNKRIQQPTKMEQVLNVFKENLGKTVNTELLLPIFEGSSDKDRQLRLALFKLNQRLEPFGIHLEHVPTYQAVRTLPE
ncbi:MAG: hypothetical protein LCI00_24315 [Chloroflexi bacterium]|nr:hypothetical protein [Chloroflexota bacterium]